MTILIFIIWYLIGMASFLYWECWYIKSDICLGHLITMWFFGICGPLTLVVGWFMLVGPIINWNRIVWRHPNNHE